jgi:hypothetical protein
MKRVVAIWLALIAGSAMMAAQAIDQYQPRKFDAQAAQAQPMLTLDLRAMRAPTNAGCPAAFTAKQGGMGDLVAVKPEQKSENGKGFSQHIRLSVAGIKNNASVVEATVTVHGLTQKARVVPVQSGAGGPAQTSRKMDVSFGSNSTDKSAADLTLSGFTAVFSIDIDSVTYSDGSTWRTGTGVCRVIPDPLMLISAR